VSTILDALKKLQREKAAQNPGRDLHGSVANDSGFRRAPRRSGVGRALTSAALLALLAGGGWWLWSSGRVAPLVARFAGGAGDDAAASEAELDALERELAAAEAEVAPQPAPESPPAAGAPRARAIAIPPAPPAPAQETPEMTAERTRLEAVIAQAREAQEAQRRAEVTAAAQPPAPPQAPPAAAPVPGPESPAPEAAPTPKPAPAPVAKPAAPVAKAAAPKPRAPIAKPKPAPRPAAAPAPKPAPPARAPERVTAGVTFPTVFVDSIRWHPIPERRVASLRFEQQNAPEAHEGDIVAGVLVYRIDPGAVELRIGDAQRVVRPGS
jgi:hypothetical protein